MFFRSDVPGVAVPAGRSYSAPPACRLDCCKFIRQRAADPPARAGVSLIEAGCTPCRTATANSSADCVVALSTVPVQAAIACAPVRSRRALMRYYGSFVACIAASLALSVGPLQLLAPGTVALRLSLLGMAERRPDPLQEPSTPSPATLSRWTAAAFALEASVALG